MINSNEVQQIADRTVYTSDNDKIGKAGQVYLDDESGQPEWVTVNTGLFGTHESFVPLREASLTDEGVTVPYSKDKVKDAPNVDPDAGHITPEEEQHLYEYYGLTEDTTDAAAARQGRSDVDLRDGDLPSDQNVDEQGGRERAGVAELDEGHEPGEGHDTSGPNTDEAMTRSEEQLNVGTTTRESGKARLRKYVVTEEQTVTEEQQVTDQVRTEQVRKEQIDTDGLEQTADRTDADTTRR